jgi:hypothetical protein
MTYRNRIVEFIRVPADQLKPDPKNWRKHPEAQSNALRGLLAEIGFADAVLARRLSDGSLMLVDGHLRAETVTSEIPTLVLDVDENEAHKILLTLDSLAGLASTDHDGLESLLEGMESKNAAVNDLLRKLLASTQWDGVEGIDPEAIDDYDPDTETVSIRIGHIPHEDVERVANAVVAAVNQCGFSYAVESSGHQGQDQGTADG